MKERRTTSFDIAYRAGVSQSTVSRALRDSPQVSPETRKRVQDIARELNYQVDRHAAGLRSQSSHTLALLLFEDTTSDQSHINPFFLSMLGNITRVAAARGYDVLVSFQQLSDDWHGEYELSKRADGIILLGYGDYMSYRSKLDQLSAHGAHFIIWGPNVEGQPGLSLGCDNYRGGYDVTRHLLELGHRRIAFVGGADEHCPELLLRYQGHCAALREAGIETDPDLRFDAETLEADGATAVDNLLAAGLPVTALTCASDLIAIGAIRALQSQGLRVPQDISVVGFDDLPAASYVNPALTTVHQDTLLASQQLVEKLLLSINEEPAESGLITPSLIVRESCGPPPDA